MTRKPGRGQPKGQSVDQAATDADQTASDAYQTSSDLDQTASDRDQEASESDQRASDRDGAAAADELAGPSADPERMRAHDQAQARRAEGTLMRSANSLVRLGIAKDRDEQAVRRDEEAQIRDETAARRDKAADLAEQEAKELARTTAVNDVSVREALEAAARARVKASAARAKASSDRAHAARDREAAALDRELLQAEVERSQRDELTGAYRRGLGEVLLSHEILRSERTNKSMMVAFLDVDMLKSTNDKFGHAAGDVVLQSVCSALQSRLRPYDTIIRWGGDEFLCAIPGAAVADAKKRIEDAKTDLSKLDPPVRISYGLAWLQAGDTLPELVARADSGLLESRESALPDLED